MREAVAGLVTRYTNSAWIRPLAGSIRFDSAASSTHYAKQLRDAPGAARLARLARTAKGIPESLLTDLAALIVQLDGVQLIGSDISLHLIDVGDCDARDAFGAMPDTRCERLKLL